MQPWGGRAEMDEEWDGRRAVCVHALKSEMTIVQSQR